MNTKVAIAGIFCLAGMGGFCSAPWAQSMARRLQGSGLSSDQRSRSVWDGVYTEKQAKRGEDLYGQNCRRCHNVALTGDDNASALAGLTFLQNWNQLTVGDLFERIRISMPQDKPGELSRQTYIDVVAYILSYNKFPAGKTDLAIQDEILRQIRIDALKPEPKQNPTKDK